jgi:hypothetical protein
MAMPQSQWNPPLDDIPLSLRPPPDEVLTGAFVSPAGTRSLFQLPLPPELTRPDSFNPDHTVSGPSVTRFQDPSLLMVRKGFYPCPSCRFWDVTGERVVGLPTLQQVIFKEKSGVPQGKTSTFQKAYGGAKVPCRFQATVRNPVVDSVCTMKNGRSPPAAFPDVLPGRILQQRTGSDDADLPSFCPAYSD